MKRDPNSILQRDGPSGLRKALDATPAEPKPNGRDKDGLGIVMGSQIVMRAISWLWPGWLARGKLQILAGRPGSLKTTMALAWAATVTRGWRWPDGTLSPGFEVAPDGFIKPGNVLVWSGEDAADDTLLPRFIAAGGDPDRIGFISTVTEDGAKRNFDPARDMPRVAGDAARMGDVRLILIDPLVSVTKSDSHKNAETRRDLQPFVDVLEKTNAAGLGVHHLTKGTEGQHPLERLTGSLAFGAAARLVMLSATDEKAPGPPRGTVMRAKSSIGEPRGGFNFTGEMRPLDDHPDIIAQRVLWGDYIDESAREILARLEAKPEKEKPQRAVVAWLETTLKAGPRLASDVIAQGEAAGYGERALQRALRDLGGASKSTGFQGARTWGLPEPSDF